MLDWHEYLLAQIVTCAAVPIWLYIRASYAADCVVDDLFIGLS